MLTQLFEKTLNTYLKLDPDTLNEINALKKQSLLLEITDLDIFFLLRFNGHGIQVQKASKTTKAKTTLKGASVYLFLSSFSKSAEKKIEIEGDIELGYQIASLLKHVDIDWEEHLSKVTGDVFANEVGKFFGALKNAAKKTKNRLTENLADYLHEESDLFPNPLEVENFYREVRKLKQDVERLEARMKQAKQTND